MKKLATTFGLLALLLVVTSFTTPNEIGGKDRPEPVLFEIGGKDKPEPVLFEIGGKDRPEPVLFEIGGKDFLAKARFGRFEKTDQSQFYNRNITYKKTTK